MLYPSSTQFSASMPREGRLLGLDLGDTTIGLALTDAGRMIASPLETIERSKFAKDLAKLEAIIAKHKAVGLVIGLPVNMDGSSGPRVQSTRTFVSNISKTISLPMLLWDERMSTMAVERMMIDADMTRQRRAVLVDKLAASYMLQGYLDSVKG